MPLRPNRSDRLPGVSSSAAQPRLKESTTHSSSVVVVVACIGQLAYVDGQRSSHGPAGQPNRLPRNQTQLRGPCRGSTGRGDARSVRPGVAGAALRLVAPMLGRQGCELGTGGDIQLGENVRQMRLHGPARHVQALADLRIRQCLGDQPGNRALRRGQTVPAGPRPAARAPGGRGGCPSRAGLPRRWPGCVRHRVSRRWRSPDRGAGVRDRCAGAWRMRHPHPGRQGRARADEPRA
jgi:hypothetical protein